MTIYNKNGSLAVTLAQQLTTQTIQAVNRSNSSSGMSSVVSNVPSYIQLDDEDEFIERTKWESVRKLAEIVYDVNIAVAVIQSVVGLLLLTTIVDRKLREKSQMWYMYHMITLSIFIGLILHPASHAGLVYQTEQACYFVMYSAEYAFFGFGMAIVMADLEIYFTKILNLQRWESSPFYRFLVLILCGWLIVCFIVAHVVINNNSGTGSKFCFYFKDKSVRHARFALRSIVPAVVCFLLTIVTMVTYALKRSRITFTNMSGELMEIRTDGRDDEPQWLKCTIFMNVVYIIRETAMMVLFFMSTVRSPDHYRMVIFIVFIHVQAMYTVPFCLFFIADVRIALKRILLKALEKVSFGKVRLGDDLENLAVSFGNMSQTDNS